MKENYFITINREKLMKFGNFDDTLSYRQKMGIVILLFVLGLFMNLSCFNGLISSDDLGYYGYAKKIAEGNYTLEHHHFAIRFGLLLPVAFSYKLFGINEWTTVLVPFLSSIFSVPLLTIIGWRLFGFTAGIIAGILFTTFPIQLYLSTILVPETVANFYILIALAFYVMEYKNFDFNFSILCGAFIGIAYLTKEPSIFVIVALLIDTLLNKKWKKLIGLALGCGSIIAIEHIYYLYVANDLLYRPHAMAVHHKAQMAVAANQNLYYRLVVSYPRMMIVPNLNFGLHSISAILISTLSLKLFKLKRTLFIILWSSLPWLYLNFGTSSFSEHFALPVQPRYIAFVYSPLFILTGAVISRIFSTNKLKYIVPSFLLVGIIVLSGFICGYLIKGQFFYSDHAKALKLIVKKAEEIPLTKYVILSNDRDKYRWRQTIEILSDSIRIDEINKEQALIIKRGDLGLPEAHLNN